MATAGTYFVGSQVFEPSCRVLRSRASLQHANRPAVVSAPHLTKLRLKAQLSVPGLVGKSFLGGGARGLSSEVNVVHRRRHLRPCAQLIVEPGGRGESENGAVSEPRVTPDLIAALEKQLQAEATDRKGLKGTGLEAQPAVDSNGISVNGKASAAIIDTNPTVEPPIVNEALQRRENGAAKAPEPDLLNPVTGPSVKVQDAPRATRKPQVQHFRIL
jgi:hypothetical protein